MTVDNGVEAERTENPGCVQWMVIAFALLWVTGCTLLSQFSGWVVDEIQYEGGRGFVYPAVRFGISLGFGVLAVTVTLLLSWLAKRSPFRQYYAAWALAAGLACCLSPIRFIGLTQSQTVNLAQVGLGSVYGLALFLILRRNKWLDFSTGDAWRGWLPLLLAVAVSALPWVMWGALGSWVDTLLNLASAFVFGLNVWLVQSAGRHFSGGKAWGKPTWTWILDSISLTTVAMVVATGYGTVGTEALLAVALLGLGWIASAFDPYRHDGRGWLSFVSLVSLLALFPLAFFDPDELSLTVGSGTGEVVQWALICALTAGVIGLLIGLVYRLGEKFIFSSSPRSVWLMRLGVISVWAGAAVCAFVIGHPGFYGERLFVIMKDQKDVSAANAMPDLAERRAWVYQALVEHAGQSQSSLRQQLDRFGVDYAPYYLVNGLEVDGGPIMRLWLQNRTDVDRVLDSPHLRPLVETPQTARGMESAPSGPAWNLTMIHADRVWKYLGVTGAGITIGHADSGVQGDHPELADSYRGASTGGDFNWLDPWNGSTSPQDIGGHGTHTLGTILGDHTGVAPDATWFGCVNLARNLGNPAVYLDCMQFLLAPYPQQGNPFTDGDPSLSADVVSNSWGCPPIEGCDATALEPAVEAMRAAGIFMVAAAGNSGSFGCGTVSDPPAVYSAVYSVGAVDSFYNLANFSSLGPATIDNLVISKPEIAAPGVDVLSAFPGNTYQLASGTSMASPHVAGVVALMWSANPKLKGQIDATVDILNRTADAYPGTQPACVTGGDAPNNAVGWGIVNAYAAVKGALQYQP